MRIDESAPLLCNGQGSQPRCSILKKSYPLFAKFGREQPSAISVDRVREMLKQAISMRGFRSVVLEGYTAYGAWTVDHEKVEDVVGF